MEVTLEITQFCENNCSYCSSKASPEGEHLDYNKIFAFLSNRANAITRINISGGEPLEHPHFTDILRLCYAICDDVRIYTNLIKHIIYNANILKDGIIVEANVCVIPGTYVYVPDNADRVRLLKLVPQGRAEGMKDIPITASSNFEHDTHNCNDCNHIVLQSDGAIVSAPCKKRYS